MTAPLNPAMRMSMIPSTTITAAAAPILHLLVPPLGERQRALLKELLASPLLNDEEKEMLAVYEGLLETDPARALGNTLITVIDVAMARYAEKGQVHKSLVLAKKQAALLLQESLPAEVTVTIFLGELEEEINQARALQQRLQAIDESFQRAQAELYREANRLNREMGTGALRAAVIELQEERLKAVQRTTEEVERNFQEQQRGAERLQEVGQGIIRAAEHWQQTHDRLQGTLNTGVTVVRGIK